MPLEKLNRAGREWDPALRAEITDLVTPSYVDARAVLAREFEHNDVAYLARDIGGRLVAFFLVAWEDIPIEGQLTPTVYLGLSATSQSTKGTGTVREAYSAFIADAVAWEQEQGRRLVLWGTTATPSAYNAVRLLFADLQPLPDGGFSPTQVAAVARFRECLGVGPPAADEHPFVLRGVAANTLYAPEESARITRISRDKQFRLFDLLGIDERRGDRLLLLCRVPGQHDGEEESGDRA
jgi:hypothetical protein